MSHRETNTAKNKKKINKKKSQKPCDWLTQLRDLSVEGTADRSAMEGQPGETVMAHGVTTQQKTRDFIPL